MHGALPVFGYGVEDRIRREGLADSVFGQVVGRVSPLLSEEHLDPPGFLRGRGGRKPSRSQRHGNEGQKESGRALSHTGGVIVNWRARKELLPAALPLRRDGSKSFYPHKLYVIGFSLHRLEVGSHQPIVFRIVPQVVERTRVIDVT
jgi:hypothetical protein